MSVKRRINTDLGFIPCRTIEDMKSNTELIIGDYVVIADTLTVYEVVSEKQKIEINNNLYAKLLFSFKNMNDFLETKYDKTGGTISGNVVVTGNEVVNGSISCNSIILNGYTITIE